MTTRRGRPVSDARSLVLGSVTPSGSVQTFAGTTVPAGYLLCDGSAVSRTTYSELFAIIGTSHGEGDGSTTFHLPDYRGRFLRGTDNGAGRDLDAINRTAANAGGNIGDSVGTVQDDEMKSHLHSTFSYRPGVGVAGNFFPFNNGTRDFDFSRDSGSAGGSESRPMNINVNYIIKV